MTPDFDQYLSSKLDESCTMATIILGMNLLFWVLITVAEFSA